MMKSRIQTYLLLLVLPLAFNSHAKEPLISDGKAPKPYKLSEFNWQDKELIKSQTEKINELGKFKLGQPVRGTLDDIGLLQRIIYRGLIKKTDTIQLQAMGIVLGNLMVKEFKLEWMVLEDSLGRSRAVCAPESQECLFPVTLLSKRIEVGILPDVQKLFDEGYQHIKAHLPKQPYSD
jgi:hypothetical protein